MYVYMHCFSLVDVNITCIKINKAKFAGSLFFIFYSALSLNVLVKHFYNQTNILHVLILFIQKETQEIYKTYLDVLCEDFIYWQERGRHRSISK